MPEDTIVRVYKFGILPQVPRDARGRPNGRRRDLPLEMVAEIERAFRLRSKLIALELAYQARVQEIWLSNTEISELTGQAGQLVKTVDELEAETRTLRGKNTGKTKIMEDLTAARKELKEARKALREAKNSRGYLLLKDQFEAAKREHYAAVKALYRPAVEGGLYWGTYNATLAHHKNAVQGVHARRKEGLPAQLRAGEFDGSGTIAVQLQAAESGAPDRTPKAIADGERANVLQLKPWYPPDEWASFTSTQRNKRSRGTLRFRIGSDVFRPQLALLEAERYLAKNELPEQQQWLLRLLALDADTGREQKGNSYRGMSRKELAADSGLDEDAFSRALKGLEKAGLAWTGHHVIFLKGAAYASVVTLPVRVHRMMPAGAEIVSAQVTRRRIGDDYRSYVTLTARIPRPPVKTEGPLAALHMGWRQLDEGSLRVAVVRGIPAPENRWLAEHGVVRSHDGWHEVIIPRSWRDVFENTSSIRSQRDRNRRAMVAHLLHHLEQRPRDAELLCAPAELRRRQGSHFYRNLIAGLEVENELYTLAPELRELLEYLKAWAKQDRHLFAWTAHEKDQIIGRRDYAYQLVAKWLCSVAAQVVVDGWDLSALARKPKDADKQLPLPARANRVMASPGQLREYVVHAGVTHGARVRLAAKLPPLRHSCGDPLTGTGLMLWCDRCRVMVDQDVAALGMLETWARA